MKIIPESPSECKVDTQQQADLQLGAVILGGGGGGHALLPPATAVAPSSRDPVWASQVRHVCAKLETNKGSPKKKG